SWCGPGRDTASPSSNDYIARDCEELQFGLRISKEEFADMKGISVKPFPAVNGAGSVTFRVQCPFLDTDGYPDPVAMRGTLRLRSPDGRALGAGRIGN